MINEYTAVENHETALRISKLAARVLTSLRNYAVDLAREDPDHQGEIHVAFTIAVESLRQVLVLQYPEDVKSIIFEAAERLCKPKDAYATRPKEKA